MPSLGGTAPYVPLCAKSLPFPGSAPPSFLLRKQVAANAHKQCYGTRSPWTQEKKIHCKVERNVPPTKHRPALLQLMSTKEARDYADVGKGNLLAETDPARQG